MANAPNARAQLHELKITARSPRPVFILPQNMGLPTLFFAFCVFTQRLLFKSLPEFLRKI
jgi:hypothetical protein